MKSNILSLGQLFEKDYDIHMKNKKLYLRNNTNDLIAQVEMSKNKMFILDIRNDVAECFKAYVKDTSWLWHLRLGHLNFGDLNMLSNKQMVHDLPHIDYPN